MVRSPKSPSRMVILVAYHVWTCGHKLQSHKSNSEWAGYKRCFWIILSSPGIEFSGRDKYFLISFRLLCCVWLSTKFFWSSLVSRVEATTPSVLRLTSLAISRRWGFRFLEKRGHSINAHPVPPKYCGRTPQWFSKSGWKITFGTPYRNNLQISPMTCQCCPLCITADRAQESPAVAFEQVSVPHLKRRRLWDSAKLKSPEIHQL